MSDLEPLRSLISELKAARHFEDAASMALRVMLSATQAVLAPNERGGEGKILRGMVHFRPSDGYRRLWVEEHAHALGESFLPSATAWRWVVERGCPVSIDVERRTLRPWSSDMAESASDEAPPNSLDSLETHERLIVREATHVHVIPLRAPGRSVEGMVSIEASCKGPAVEALFSSAARDQLEMLADIAAPFLTALPLRPIVAPKPDELLPVIGASTAGLVELLRVFAQQEETILLAGPTGAGKSRLARWCHEQSRRRGQRFETLDLLSVPEELQMGELFGWKRGAFTNAVKDNPGYIARAERGTLFIDEIDKLTLKAQSGLLHMIEERVYKPLGEGTGERRADVRFVIGTNADLQGAVRAGRFREDLYYRINVLPVKVPPLTERLDEVPLWAAYMLARRHREGGEGEARLSPDAIRLLLDSPWPGNLRQLDNIVRRAYALALLDSGGAARDLLLQRPHFVRALAYEGGPGEVSAFEQLRRAAVVFVREAERRVEPDAALPLDVVDGFRGLVLLIAAQRLGSREAAFYLLGLGSLVKSRNHHKALRREVERLVELLRALGEDPERALAELGGS